MSNERVTSPASSGGAGTFFEQDVGAYWLAQLLVGAVPPVLVDSAVTGVHFQTERLGWQTDDLMVVASAENAERRLICQVKRSFSVGSNEECIRVFSDFWRDFHGGHFAPDNDKFVLTTMRGTNALLEHFSGLLSCARACANAGDFEHRLSLTGLVSSQSKRYAAEVKEIVEGVAEGPVDTAEFWAFLKAIHVLSLDLATDTRQTEAHMLTLLAHSLREATDLTAATASWKELQTLASTAMSTGQSYARSDFPEALRAAHSTVESRNRRLFGKVRSHSAVVLRGIKSTIGSGLRLPRWQLVEEVVSALASYRVVVVSGPAGSGKSAVAKHAVEELSKTQFSMVFRAEEFSEAHIDTVITNANFDSDFSTLAAALSGQERVLIVVESVERLLEKATRDAFADLLKHVAEDDRLQVILTCRDYSLDVVRESFLRPTGMPAKTVLVSPLDDGELDIVAREIPSLRGALSRPLLRRMLRNPYLLDRAAQVDWGAEASFPENERALRAVFWRWIVRDDSRPADGLPGRRDRMFQEIALARAHALTPYVPREGLDPAVVSALHQDSLLVVSDDESGISVAHDVLEDWAILEWLSKQFQRIEGSIEQLSTLVGPYPAMRRAYRSWLGEMVGQDPSDAERLFMDALDSGNVSAQFRDDTLVAMLQAAEAHEFVSRLASRIVRDDHTVLRRLILLLRVACVTEPEWLRDSNQFGSSLSVPDGSAWASVLALVAQNLEAFDASDVPLLLGLVEHAVRGVSWWAPDIDWADPTATIAHWLLARCGGYRGDKDRMRVMKVLLAVPKSDTAKLLALLEGADDESRRKAGATREFRELLFTGVEGTGFVRHLPRETVSAALDYLLASEEELADDRYFHSGLDLEPLFGMSARVAFQFFPASAFRGPWLPLLRWHPRLGMEFLLTVCNHATDWYVHPRVHDRLEAAWEVGVTFADGTTRTQWSNSRLWNLYRGTSVGPDSLQSILMAAEAWLLEFAAAHPSNLDAVLTELLRRSDGCMLPAVIASVATAHPHFSGEALLVLLSAPDYIRLDQTRAGAESGIFDVSGLFGGPRGDHVIYDSERKKSNALGHRKNHLETAIASLQLGPFADRVQELLDAHEAEVLARPEQDTGALTWRLSLRRMDLRHYSVGPLIENEDGTHQIGLEPAPLAPEVEGMVDSARADWEAMSSRLSVMRWGLDVFERRTRSDEEEWRTFLTAARGIDPDTEAFDGSSNAPGIVAAVCIRDHWSAMDATDQEWCVDVVCAEIERHCDKWEVGERIQRFRMGADRASAHGVVKLLKVGLPEAQLQRVRRAFVAALTHPVYEVRGYLCWAIDRDFWESEPEVAFRCLDATAAEADLLKQSGAKESRQDFFDRRPYEERAFEAATRVRDQFWNGGIRVNGHRDLDLQDPVQEGALQRMIVMIGQAPDGTAKVEFLERVSRALVAWWRRDDDRRRGVERNFQMEAEVAQLLQRFILRLGVEDAIRVIWPIVGEVERTPREVGDFVRGLTVAADAEEFPGCYWDLWSLFADALLRASWSKRLDGDHPHGSELLGAMFLTSGWKDEVRRWRHLAGHGDAIHALFEALPTSPLVVEDYVRFLYHVGEQELPAGFVHLAGAMTRGDGADALSDANTLFMLEILMQRHVYSRPLELKIRREIREGVLTLLDAMVEFGSSAAFRMRDDFVTPAA